MDGWKLCEAVDRCNRNFLGPHTAYTDKSYLSSRFTHGEEKEEYPGCLRFSIHDTIRRYYLCLGGHGKDGRDLIKYEKITNC